MHSVDYRGSAETISGLLQLVRAEDPVLDVTFGNGTFWVGCPRRVVGGDLQKTRARDIQMDFRAIPFGDGAFPTVVFDPPFHPFVNSAEESRFSGAGQTEKELRVIFEDGVRECWRVTRRHLVVKCQGFVHNHRPQWMPLWAINVAGEPFEWAISARGGKRMSGRWKNEYSLRRNHADYLLFDKKTNHR